MCSKNKLIEFDKIYDLIQDINARKWKKSTNAYDKHMYSSDLCDRLLEELSAFEVYDKHNNVWYNNHDDYIQAQSGADIKPYDTAQEAVTAFYNDVKITLKAALSFNAELYKRAKRKGNHEDAVGFKMVCFAIHDILKGITAKYDR